MAKDKTKKKNKTLKKIILAVVITLLGTLLIVAGVFADVVWVLFLQKLFFKK